MKEDNRRDIEKKTGKIILEGGIVSCPQCGAQVGRLLFNEKLQPLLGMFDYWPDKWDGKCRDKRCEAPIWSVTQAVYSTGTGDRSGILRSVKDDQ